MNEVITIKMPAALAKEVLDQLTRDIERITDGEMNEDWAEECIRLLAEAWDVLATAVDAAA